MRRSGPAGLRVPDGGLAQAPFPFTGETRQSKVQDRLVSSFVSRQVNEPQTYMYHTMSDIERPHLSRQVPMSLQTPRVLLPILALLCVATGWNSLEAQTVTGRLTDDSGEGLEGAMVRLLDREGESTTQALTNAAGNFELDGVPGEYRLRADRIGHASSFSDWFILAEGETVSVSLSSAVEAIRLGSIDVEADRRCRVRPEEGLAVTQVWDEARKALAAAAWTQERGVYRYEMMDITRSLDRDGRRVLDEERSFNQGYSRAPYISLPANTLAEAGFVTEDEQGLAFYAPDAAVLLSDEFLDTHCFRLRQGEDEAEGLIGLEFEPTRGRRVTDIEGTLWIDPNTTLLRWLDFRYTNLPFPDELQSGLVGGRVAFSALPNGTWIVSQWRLQMPRSGTRRNDLTGQRYAYLEGYAVQGGQVLRVHGEEGTVALSEQEGSRITGAVFDTLRAGGLEGARVYVLNTGIEAVTGFDGRFTIGGLDPGVYDVTFGHPYFDELGYVPLPYPVEVGQDTVAQVTFLAPPKRRIVDELCQDDPRPDTRGIAAGQGVHDANAILMGQVTDEGGTPVAGAAVRVLWREWSVDFREDQPSSDDLVNEGRLGAVAITGPTGLYRVCWVPADVPLQVTVLERLEDLDPGRQTAFRNLIELGAARREQFTIPGSSQFATRNLELSLERTGTIEGRVTGVEDLAGAVIHLVELDRRVALEPDGSFVFDAVPTGDLTVEITADGHTVRRSVEVRAGESAVVDVTLPDATILSPSPTR